MSEQDQQLTIQ